MLTIFGKKKKEDEKKENPLANVQAPQPTALPPTTGTAQEESPFAKIFQSISQEYQNSTPPNRPESVGAPPLSVTPDWVQPRELPRSNRMVIQSPNSKSPRPSDRGGWESKGDPKAGATAQPKTTPFAPAQFQPPSNRPTAPLDQPLQREDEDTDQPRAAAKAIGGQLGSAHAQMPANLDNSEPEPKASGSPSPTLQAEKKKEEDRNTGDSQKGGSTTFTEGLSSIDSTGEFSLSGFDDISKLLAETDSVLAQGREKEQEFSVEKPTPPKKIFGPKEGTKTPEAPVTLPADKQSQAKRSEDKKDFKGFEHISELTQGSLDVPGLVVVDGSPGSGKTTLCLGLADRYLKQGSPCMMVTYDQSPSAVRDEFKKIGCDITQYESNYRFMMVDAFTAQSGGFSMELYSLMEPMDVQKLQETVVANCGVFMGENVRVIIDSIDGLVSRIGPKDFGTQFDALVSKLKENGATLVASVDLSNSGKEVKSWAEDETECLLEVDVEKGKEGAEHSLNVNRLKGSKVKADAEEWDVQPGKGIVFV